MQRVNHPNFGYLYDTFHANIEEKNLARRDRDDDRRPSTTSTSPRTTAARPAPATSTWPRRSRALKRSATTAGWSIEAFGSALPDLAAATKVWRPLFDRPEDVYEGAYRLMRDGVAASRKHGLTGRIEQEWKWDSPQ